MCPEHKIAYSEVPADRRKAVVKTRPLKNPFVACGKILSNKKQITIADSESKGDKSDAGDEAYGETKDKKQIADRQNEISFGANQNQIVNSPDAP